MRMGTMVRMTLTSGYRPGPQAPVPAETLGSMGGKRRRVATAIAAVIKESRQQKSGLSDYRVFAQFLAENRKDRQRSQTGEG